MLMLLVAAVPAASQAGVAECHLKGSAGQFVVRKVLNPNYQDEIDFSIARNWPSQLSVGDDSNYHIFTGFWLLRTSDFLQAASLFLDAGASWAPSGVAVSYQGIQPLSQPVPGSNVLVDNQQGAWGWGHLPAGTYYLIAFADGAGTFDITMTYSNFGGLSCDPYDGVTGRIVGYSALDFKGGTQVVAPGYGYADNAKLSFTNPYPNSIGAMFCYEPAPLPPADCPVENDGVKGGLHQNMMTIGGPWHDWNVWTTYQGRTDTILIELLEMSLTPG